MAAASVRLKDVNGITQRRYTKQQICKYLVAYHHLSDDMSLDNIDGIVDYIRKVGCIQYDPLDVVGRNPDLVLQSRCIDYRKSDLEKYLYVDRVLFDVWDKNMSICSVSDWPYFERFRKRYLPWCNERKEVIDEIIEYLENNEFACSSDFKFEQKVAWHYGPQRLAKAAVECMCYAGRVVVHHKKGARRYYGLAEKLIPKEYLTMENPNKTDEEYFKWVVLRRINGVGILWNRPSDAWLGIDGLKSKQRSKAFETLCNEGEITEIIVDGIDHFLYMATKNLELLETVKNSRIDTACIRILAPLDNLLWDRRLINELFNFEYKWEVYTPATQRKYGYYVLPMLCNDKFIGRVEMETDKKNSKLIVKEIWFEDENYSSLYRDNIVSGINSFKEYNLTDNLEIRCSI